MPVASLIAVASPTSPVISVPKQKLGKIKKIEIDNASTGGAITITIKDVFTPDASIGNPNPTEVEKVRKVVTVAQVDHYESRDLSIPVYGDLYVQASRDDSAVHVSIEYEMD